MKATAVLLALALPLCAQVTFQQAAGKVDILIDGKPFTTFYANGGKAKPFLAPLRAASGVEITRPVPLEGADPKEHPHHRGLWMSYDDVNTVEFWNEPGKAGKRGRIELVKLDKAKGNTLHAVFAWRSEDGKTLLREERRMTFSGNATQRVIDFDATLKAAEDLKFGDTKEGFFAIRLRDELTEEKGKARMVNAEGLSGEKEVWGKPSKWVDYAGTVQGEKVGVAIFDHPGNFRAPTRWHSRGYGLFAANPFGLRDFARDKAADGSSTLGKGKHLRFRYRVVIHAGDAKDAGIGKQFEDWAATRSAGR